MQIASRISSWTSGGGDAPAYWGLYFEAEEANAVVNMALSRSTDFTPTLETSTDGNTWTTFDPLGSTPVTLANIGDRVYFRAGSGGNSYFSRYSSWGNEYYHFTLSGKCGAHGNLLSILDGEDPAGATSLANACFFRLFLNCTDLTSAPEMPATSVGANCCHSMYRGCTSLVTAPTILPATTLNQSCYKEYFYGCSSLTNAPALPAMAVSEGGYEAMFYGCTSLTTAPALPATTLAKNCYQEMFSGCTSLIAAPSMAATALAYQCCFQMFYGCASLTTAHVPPATTLADSCYRRMYMNCTALVTAPALPATTLAAYCYYEMFELCTALSAATLPATTLVSNCYGWMFAYCSSLSSVTVGFEAWLSGATTSWMNRVNANGTFNCPYNLGDNATITRGINNCPDNWTVVNAGGRWELCFEAEEANVVVGMSKSGSPSAVTLETSTDDGETWTAFIPDNDTITLSSIGDKVYFRAGADGNTTFASDASNYHRFTLSGDAGAYGNIMSLLNGTDETNTTLSGNYCFYRLFYGNTNLTAAPQLAATTLTQYCYGEMFRGCTSLNSTPILSSTTLTIGCYEGMFLGCSSLTAAPSLPASALTASCYASMFKGCTALTSAPSLSALSLAANCYESMFEGCAALISAPTLPTTVLAQNCYASMFSGCTALTTAPHLPATTLASGCYDLMFSGCTNLASISVAFTSWGNTTNWVQNVAATGTFTCPAELGDNTTITRGASYCPSGWTVPYFSSRWELYFEAEDANVVVGMSKYGAPPSVTLETSTDDGATWSAFTPGTDTITLSAIGDKVYFRAGSGGNIRFASATSAYHRFTLSGRAGAHGNIMSLLDGTDRYNVTLSGNYCFCMLFRGCAQLTSAPELPATTLSEDCYHGLFWECTGLTSAPTLPATTLVKSCYDTICYSCSNITTVTLPAPTLADYCYSWAFHSCSRLNSVTVVFSSWPTQTGALGSWLGAVASTGTFTCPTVLGTNATITRGDSNCPSNWTVVNT